MRGSTMRESVTDVRIILECLQEAYQMEGDMVRSGKNIHAASPVDQDMYYQFETRTWSAHNRYFPIPQSERNVNNDYLSCL